MLRQFWYQTVIEAQRRAIINSVLGFAYWSLQRYHPVCVRDPVQNIFCCFKFLCVPILEGKELSTNWVVVLSEDVWNYFGLLFDEIQGFLEKNRLHVLYDTVEGHLDRFDPDLEFFYILRLDRLHLFATIFCHRKIQRWESAPFDVIKSLQCTTCRISHSHCSSFECCRFTAAERASLIKSIAKF